MKKILITVTILVLLYPVVTWLMGFAIEARIERLSDQGQQMMPALHLIQKSRHGVITSDEDSSYELASTLKVTRHYHRGWYSSVDEATVEISSAALDALPALRPAVATLSSGPDRAPFRFSLRSVIHHGPLCGSKCFAFAGAETHVSFTGLLQDSLTRLFGNEEPITIRSRFAFFGGGSATMSSPAFEHAQIGQDVRLSWGGFDGTMHYGARQEWYDVAATAPSLRLEGAKGMLEIDGMSLDVRGKQLLRTLYEGDSRINIKRLSVTGTDKDQQFAVNDLLFANQSHAPDRFMNVSYQLGSGAMVTQPLTLSSAHVDLTWKHLGLESLESLGAAARAAGQEQNASVAPAARAQSMMTALKQPLVALLLEQPEMDIDRVSIATAQGQGLVTGMHSPGRRHRRRFRPARKSPAQARRASRSCDRRGISFESAGRRSKCRDAAATDDRSGLHDALERCTAHADPVPWRAVHLQRQALQSRSHAARGDGTSGRATASVALGTSPTA